MGDELGGQILASLERINGRLDGIDARLDGIDTRLDGIDARLDRMDRRFDGIDARLDGMDKRFDGIDLRLDAMDTRFDKSDARLGRIEVRLEIVESRAAERHAELTGKLNRVEAKVDRVHEDMDDLKLRIAHVETTVHHWGGSMALQNSRNDRFDVRLALVGKRLEIRDNPAA